MRTPQTIRLPSADAGYSANSEQVMRRTVEQGMQDLRSDVVDVRDKKTGPGSLALRRFQFMLMGAP